MTNPLPSVPVQPPASDAPRRGRPRHTASALKFALLYALWGTSWILGYTWLLERLVADRVWQARLEVVGGLAFFCATAFLFGLTLRYYFQKLERSAQLLEASEERWKRALEGASQAVWDWNVVTGEVIFSPEWKAMLGYEPEEIGNQLSEWESRVHPDDLARVMAEVDRHLKGETTIYACEHRVRCKDGSFKWILDRGKVTQRAPDGKALRMVGTHSDIHRRKQAEERSRIQRDLMLALAAASRLEDGLQCCLAAALKIDGLTGGGVYVYHAGSRALKLSVHRGLSPEFIQAVAELGADSFQGRVVAVGQPVYAQLQDLQLNQSKAELREGLHALAILPMLHQGQLLGCLNLASSTHEMIPESSRLTLEIIAASAGEAIARLRAQEALRQSEEKHRGIFDESVAAIFVFDEEKHFVDANQAGLNLLGYSRDELLRLRIADVDADPTGVLPAHEKLLAGGRLVNYEHKLRRKDGAIIIVLNNSRPLTGAGGNVVGMQSTLIDITERKRAEKAVRESQRRLSLFFHQSLDGYYFTELEVPQEWNEQTDKDKVLDYIARHLRITEINDAMLAQYGATRETWLGRPVERFFAHDQDNGRRLRRRLCDEGRLRAETCERKEDGTPIWVEGDYVCLYDEQKRITGTFGIQRDITERKRRERELARTHQRSATLAHLGRELAETVEPRAAALAILASARSLLDWDCAWLRVWVEPTQQWRDLAVFDLIDGDRREVLTSPSAMADLSPVIRRALTEAQLVLRESEQGGEQLLTTFGNGRRSLSLMFAPLRVAGRLTGMMSVQSYHRDAFDPSDLELLQALADHCAGALERIRASTALGESEARYRALFDQAPEGIMLLSSEGRMIGVNTAFARMHGYERPEEMAALQLSDLDTPQSALQSTERVRKIAAGELLSFEVEHFRKDGSTFPLSVTASRVDLGGKWYLQRFHRDISEQRRSEQLRTLSAEVLQILNSPQALPDATKRILEAIKRDTGIEAVGIRLRQGPDFPYAVSAGFSGSFLEAENHLAVRAPDGKFCVDETGAVRLECTCGLVLTGKTDSANQLFTAGGSAWTNDARALLKIPREEDPRLHPRNRCIHEGYQSVALIPIRVEQEIIGLLQLNDRRKGCFTLEMIQYLEGLASSFGVALQRLKEDYALRESERRLREAQALAHVGNWSFDLVENRLEWSAESYRIFEMDPAESGTTYAAFLAAIHPEDRERVNRAYADSVRDHTRYDAEFRLLFAEGRVKHVHERCRTEYDPNGQALRSLGTVQDITERKQAEELLRQSETTYRGILNAFSEAVYVMDEAGTFVDVNQGAERMYGYQRTELIGRTPAWVSAPGKNDLPRVMEQFALALAGTPQSFEFWGLGQDGRVFPKEVHLYPGEYFGKRSVIAVAQDITERKLAEDRLQQRAVELRTLNEIGQTLSRLSKPVEVLERIAVEIGKIMDNQNLFIALLDQGEGQMRFPLYTIRGVRQARKDRPIGNGITEYVLRTKAPFLVRRNLAATLRELGLDHIGQASCSMVAVPLLVGDEAIGVLALQDYDREEVYDEHHAELLATIAAQASSALENARLYGTSQLELAERNRAEAALRESENRFRGIIEKAPDGVVLCSPEGRLTYASPAACRTFGFAPEKVQEIDPAAHTHPEDLPLVLAALEEVLREPSRIPTMQYRFRHAQGSWLWIESTFTNLVGTPGVDAIVINFRNIHDRKLAEAALHESELRRSLALEAAQMGTWDWDVVGGKTVWCKTHEAIWGYAPGTFPGTLEGYRSRIHPEDLPAVLKAGEQARQARTPYRGEFRIVWPDGSVHWVSNHGLHLFDDRGELIRMVGVVFEITERKRAEAALRESLLFRREAEKFTRIGAWKVSLDTDFLYWTEGVYDIVGAPLDFKPGLREGLQFYDADSIPPLEAALKTALRDGTPFTLEAGVTTLDGKHLWTEVRGLRRLQEGGQAYVMGTMQDITERKQRERQNELHLRILELLANEAPLPEVLAGMVVQLECGHDWFGSIMLVDETGTRLRCGAAPQLPLFYQEAINDVPIAVGRGSCGTAAATKEMVIVADIQTHPYWADYRELALRAGLRACWSVPILDAHGEVLGALAVYHSRPAVPTEQDLESIKGVKDLAGVAIGKLKAEQNLKEREATFSAIVNQAADAIAVVDANNGRFVEFNTMAHLSLGYTRAEFAGFGVRDIQTEHATEIIQRNITSARQQGGICFESKHRHRDGSLRDVRVSLQALPTRNRDYVAAVWTDITDRRRLEEQLRQAQKLEAIGQLAGGVAHDFNNILAAIMMHIGLLQMSPAVDPDTRLALHDLDTEARRAATLTRQLLMFSRRSVLAVKSLDLNEVVGNMLKMLARLVGENIAFRFDRGTALPLVEADAGMLEQVLLNLVVNARDAIRKDGRITISTSTTDYNPVDLAQNPSRHAGRFVCLAVADTGVGMDEATQNRIFEPFFTTKEAGKGTGLGLATVHGIVAQHKGWVEVESRLGQGSTFRVFLPASRQMESAPESEAPTETLRHGHETILLVEDDAKVRKAVAAGLRALGYRVHEVVNGQEAVAFWQEKAAQVDLLFTDMVMPEGITGLELIERLRALKPGLKAIISSGYSAEMVHAGIPQDSGVIYLPKPYDTTQLSQIVRQCLDHAS